MREKLGCKHDVSECYSPPRVVKMARTLGIKGSVSLDLTVPASDRYIWDFNRKHCRDKALEIVNDQKPLFLMLSPECTPYSNIQNLHMRTPAGKAKVDEARRRGDVHLVFCATPAHKRIEGGRYFVYEHPKSAASWKNPRIEKFASTPGVMRTEPGQCKSGVKPEDSARLRVSIDIGGLESLKFRVDVLVRGRAKSGGRSLNAHKCLRHPAAAFNNSANGPCLDHVPTGLLLACVNLVVLVVMLCVVLVVLVLMCCIAGWHGRALPEDDPGQGFNWNVLILLC